MTAKDDPLLLEKARVRRAFDRAALTYDSAAVLQREIGARMAERLALVRLAPARVLDAGCGTGESMGELGARFPGASITGLDFAYNMVAAARARAAGDRTALASVLPAAIEDRAVPAVVCADITALPFAPRSFDLVWSNLALQWVDDVERAFVQSYRVLAVGGLLTFTTFGPDTLLELRQAFASVDGEPHTHRFVDMHDLGDLLLHTKFADPVMDAERITLTYADPRSLMLDLKAIGARNAASGRRRTLTGRRRFAAVLAALEQRRHAGRLPATFEVIYGHAWKLEPRTTADGLPIVRFRPAP